MRRPERSGGDPLGTLTKRSALLLAALLVAATLSLPAAVAAASATVRITDRLEPATVRVTAGTTVTWRNDSGERHRMRSVDHSGDADWDTGNIEPGERASVTFRSPGTFVYVDERDDDNRAFHGTVIVSPAGGGDGGGAPAPSQPGATVAPGAPAAPATPTAATVLMGGRVFSPPSVTIAAGGTVTFRNNDDDEHTATATDVAWDSGVLAPGAAFDRRFPTPGTFAFLCLLHPEMTGTVTVQATGNAAPDPEPAQPVATPRPTPAATASPTSPPPSGAPSAPAAPAAPAGRTVDVAMVDLAFEPAAIEAVAGSTIRWTNAGAAPHTATAANGAFDSGIVPSGGTFEVTLDTPGTFAYVCELHPGMAGSIVVAAGAGSPTGTGESPPAATASSVPASTAPTPPSAEASASPPPVAVANPGSGAGSPSGAAGSEVARVAPARTSVDLTRLGIVILLVGAAMGLFGRIVRSVVRPR